MAETTGELRRAEEESWVDAVRVNEDGTYTFLLSQGFIYTWHPPKRGISAQLDVSTRDGMVARRLLLPGDGVALNGMPPPTPPGVVQLDG